MVLIRVDLLPDGSWIEGRAAWEWHITLMICGAAALALVSSRSAGSSADQALPSLHSRTTADCSRQAGQLGGGHPVVVD